MSSNERYTPVNAAGALVWRVRDTRLQVLIIHRPRYQDWSWPKGKLDPGESAQVAAVREVAEETGYRVFLGRALPTVSYRVNGDKRTKRVQYWSAQVAPEDHLALAAHTGTTEVDPEEIDQVRWVNVDKAMRMLSRNTDRKPLQKLIDEYAAGRLDTVTLVITRHARAKKRSAWNGGEETRPLTPTGKSRAQALRALLGAYGIENLITSPWERCLSTVLPYNALTGARLFQAPWLTEAAVQEEPKHVPKQLGNLLPVLAQPTALCTHRPVLPTVIAEISKMCRVWTQGELPEKDPFLNPGESLVVHLRKPGPPRVVAIEEVTPPLVG